VSLLEIFPEYLLKPDALEDFLLVLKELPIDDMRKKQVLIEWTRITGVALTEDMIDAVITHPREV